MNFNSVSPLYFTETETTGCTFHMGINNYFLSPLMNPD